MTDYDRWLAQLDHDRPNWPVEFATQQDLVQSLHRLQADPTVSGLLYTRHALRSCVGPRLWSAVQAYHTMLISQGKV